MNKPITIDGVEYIPKPTPCGLRCVVVLDRGWIFVGDLATAPNGYHVLSNCSNVRKWASGGFGGMCRDPQLAGVVLDPCADLAFTVDAPLFTVPVEDGWGE